MLKGHHTPFICRLAGKLLEYIEYNRTFRVLRMNSNVKLGYYPHMLCLRY